MAIPSLLGSYIDQTYQRLVQTQGGEFADGLGNTITFGTTNTGSLLTTASVVLNTITFKKGDGTTFPITVNTGSGGGVAFPYTGSATITGSLVITGSTASSLGFTGSLQGTASYVSGSIFTSVNPALSASFAATASRAISSSFATTSSYSLRTLAAGNNNEIQFNFNNALSASSKLSWDENGPFLINKGYYVMDFPLDSGGGFLGRGSNNLLFQMGFNAQGQYGGTLGDISGNQFFVYNFQGTGGAANYYWGFNNTGDNYWGSSNTRYSVRIQQPLPDNGITPDDGNIIPLKINLDNIDSDNTDGFNSHLVLNNLNEFGQTSITSIINGTVVAKWRTDYVGNMNWAAGAGGSHAFYTDGDFNVGQSRMCIFNNGNVLIKNSGVGGANIDEGYKLDVSGSGVSGSVRFQNGLDITGSLKQNGYEVKPYKAYTALLTQTGGTSIQTWESGTGPLILGYTYQIVGNDGGTADFTNVGAPNNDVGTYFLAIGTTPNSWGVSDNGGLEYNLGAPTAKILENNIGNIWFGINGDGDYNVNSSGLFTTDKTFVIIGSAAEGAINGAYVTVVPSTDSIMYISSVNTSTLSPLNDELLNTSFEIRVYN
jgi:hypothetical protein